MFQARRRESPPSRLADRRIAASEAPASSCHRTSTCLVSQEELPRSAVSSTSTLSGTPSRRRSPKSISSIRRPLKVVVACTSQHRITWSLAASAFTSDSASDGSDGVVRAILRALKRSGRVAYPALVEGSFSSAPRMRSVTRGELISRLPKPGSAPAAIASACASG